MWHMIRIERRVRQTPTSAFSSGNTLRIISRIFGGAYSAQVTSSVFGTAACCDVTKAATSSTRGPFHLCSMHDVPGLSCPSEGFEGDGEDWLSSGWFSLGISGKELSPNDGVRIAFFLALCLEFRGLGMPEWPLLTLSVQNMLRHTLPNRLLVCTRYSLRLPEYHSYPTQQAKEEKVIFQPASVLSITFLSYIAFLFCNLG